MAYFAFTAFTRFHAIIFGGEGRGGGGAGGAGRREMGLILNCEWKKYG